MPDLPGALWVRLSEAGCAYSVLPATAAVTADEAHQQLFPDPRERDGYRVELYSPQQWTRQGAPCFTARCIHQTTETTRRGTK